MPILTSDTEGTLGGRNVRLEGLPDFSAGDPVFRINRFQGLDDVSDTDATLVANGGGPGAVAVDPWLPLEHFYELQGRIMCAPDEKAAFRRLLLAALPADREATVVIVGNGRDVDKQIFVRRYDKPSLPGGESPLWFTFALVAPDPYKYGLTPLSATAGGFAPSSWFRTYQPDGTGRWFRTYSSGGAHYRQYTEAAGQTSSLPRSAQLESAGDAKSRRVTTTVTGPVAAGEWWVEDADGNRSWVDVSLAAGQSVVLDSRLRTATLAGQDVSHLVGGEFLTLAPGGSTFRLVVAASGEGSFMHIEGLEAYL